MNKWEEKRVEEVCEKIVSGGTPNTKRQEYYQNGKIYWLKTKEVSNNFIYSTEQKITEEGLNNSSAKLIPANSVIIAMYGDGKTAGRVAVNKIPLATNQACCNLILNSKIADYKFVFYNLLSRYSELVQLKLGGSQQNLNGNTIKKLKISLPPLQIQQKISDILSAYDNLIENNNLRIELLEKATEKLYKEWFVRFRFPDYKKTKFENGLPKGWKVVKLGDVVEIIDGDRGSNYPRQEEFFDEGYCLFLNASNVTKTGFNFSNNNFISKEKDEKLRKGKLQRNDIIMTTRGTVGNIALYNEFVKYNDIRINSGMVIIREKAKEIPIDFLYALLRSENMKKSIRLYSSGSAQPQLPIKDMRKLNLILPSNKLIYEYNNKVQNTNLLISNLQNRNLNLIKQRDLLLPRLMSGKLDV